MRTYTVRSAGLVRLDGRQVPSLTVDVVLHGDPDDPADPHQGPGLRWARAVQAGDAVNVLVPSAEAPAWSGWRQTGAHRVLAVGDETAVPALVSVAEELADPFGGFDGEADLVLELPHDGQAADLIAERLAVPEPWDWRAVTELADRGRVRLHVGRRAPGAPSGSWAHARLAALLGVDPDDAGGPVAPPAASVEREWTVAALEADERPEAYVFLAGESAMVRALRRLSVGPGGVPKKHVSFMGYWREGQAES
ncbi:siderophore-interacting protein [Micrococcus luteus]